MYNWFECKVKYDKLVDGVPKADVPETYVVDAFTISEAEKRITEELQVYCAGQFNVTDIKKVKFAEVFSLHEYNDYRWYKVKIAMMSIDEERGKEKIINQFLLIKATSLTEALAELQEGMKGSVMDYTIKSVVETAYIDVFPYQVVAGATPEK